MRMKMQWTVYTWKWEYGLLDYIELKWERFSCSLNYLLKYEAWMSHNRWYSSGYNGLRSSTFLLDLTPLIFVLLP